MKFSLSEIKFADFKLFDLKRREIQRIINAEDEVRLSPYKDNKLIKHELIKFKANVF